MSQPKNSRLHFTGDEYEYSRFLSTKPLKGEDASCLVLYYMKKNGLENECKELVYLIAALDYMAKVHDALLLDLRDLKQRLAKMHNQHSLAANMTANLTGELKTAASEFRGPLQTIREKFIEWEETTLNDVKQSGAPVLDAALFNLRILPHLEALQESAHSAMEQFGPEAIGQELRQINSRQDIYFQTDIIPAMLTFYATFAHGIEAICEAKGALDRLRTAVERRRGEQERTSVLNQLGQHKKSLLPVQEPGKKPHEVER